MASNDALEIQSVISRYTNCVNRKDWSKLPDIFAKTSRWSAPAVPDATFESYEAILEGIPRLVEATTSITQLNTPSDISIDGDRAIAQCSIRETGSIAEEGIRFEAHGIYDDELVREDGKWKFSSRLFTLLENYFTQLPK